MWVSSSSNASLLSAPGCSSGSSGSSGSLSYPQFFDCNEDKISLIAFTVFTAANLFLLPLYIRILWMGFRRRRPRNSVTAGTTTSHSDVITYHMVAVEVVGVSGLVWYCSAMHTCSLGMLKAGYYTLALTFPGQTFFHCLTCMERYLAVVHPVTYMGLRAGGGVQLRNASIACVWLQSFVLAAVTALVYPRFPAIMMFVTVTISIAVVSFCSASTLWVLIRLGLGKVGGHRIDPSKQRAFNTIMAILGTLMLRFSGLLVCNYIYNLQTETGKTGCLVLMSGFWLCIPSNLVLPVLFLHRAGTRR